MLQIILIVIYIIGLLIWMEIEKKYFLYEEGMYRKQINRGRKITSEINDCNAKIRAVLWPLFLCIIILSLLVKLLDKINYKI